MTEEEKKAKAEAKAKADAEKKAKASESTVTFSTEQLDVINKMLEERMSMVKSQTTENPNNGVSVYNLRDPKSIENVMVSRFDGKWVIGFKNLQQDIYKKNIPLYLRYGVDPIRKLPNEPYVTLLLTNDGKDIEEKEVLLITYMENRSKEMIPVLEIRLDEKIHDHGILGRSSQYAVAYGDNNKPAERTTILAQSKSEVRTFKVHLEGFAEPIWLSTDFLG
jgi:hypothetical protein